MIITDQPTQTTRTPPDLRRFWRVAIAVALPLGPLAVVVARGLMPYWTNQDTATMVQHIAAAPERMAALSWLGLFLLPLMIINVVALGYLARRGAPVLATIGTVTSFAAYTLSPAVGNTDYTAMVLLGNGYPTDEVTRIVDLHAATPMGTVTGITFVLGHIVGLVVLSIALRRAGLLPLWAAVLLAISQPIHLVSAIVVPSRLLDLVGGWGLTTVGCLVLAVQVWRMRDADWDLPPATVRSSR